MTNTINFAPNCQLNFDYRGVLKIHNFIIVCSIEISVDIFKIGIKFDSQILSKSETWPLPNCG